MIYKNNLINNIKQVKKENPKSKICAMVKANAYGVGDVEVVKTLDEYADFFGVACFFEAERIKEHTTKPILILGSVEKQHINERFSYSCGDIEDLKFLISLNKPIKIHLKINSGMNRYGFKDIRKFKKVLNMISQSKLVLEGVFTHFATVDEFVEVQMKNFKSFLKVCENFNFKPIVHADNSFVNEKFNHNFDMVRVGFSLYNRSDGWFLPAVEIKSEIVQVQEVSKGELIGYDYRCVANKNMRVGIIPIGYADGFDLKLVGFNLSVNNISCKVLNISMDCFFLDVSNINLKKGSEIYVLNKFNSLNHYSEHLETSVYEIMTKFNAMRAERFLI